MSRKSKIDPVEKVKVVERVLADEISVSEAARLTGVSKNSIQRWRNLYLSDSPTALMTQHNNKVYSQELKLQAVCEYLDGKSSKAVLNDRQSFIRCCASGFPHVAASSA